MACHRPLADVLAVPQFPLSAKYDPEWVLANQMGPNALWLMEALCQVMPIEPGMRVLDLGCGRAISSILLAREIGVQVWATDLWIGASENLERIREAGLEDQVFPIHAEAHALPYADGFFDAIVSVDSFLYYGTEEFYLPYVLRFVKPGGRIGTVDVGLLQELPDYPPAYLGRHSDWPLTGYYSAAWWGRHWAGTGLVEVESAEAVPNSGALWRRWEELRAAREPDSAHRAKEAAMFREDDGRYLGWVRVVVRKC
jgi:SAM-dependent methyltransferase